MLEHEKQIIDYENTIAQVKAQNHSNEIWSEEEIGRLEEKLEHLKTKVYSKLNAWERVMISRHPKRPRSSDFIKNLCDSFTEIFGDRLFGDDPAIVSGFGKIGGQKFAIIGHEKGSDTESRLYRNFGMPHPEGYRKALRVMQLAEKFRLPVLCLVDTPGAYPGLAAEERGQGLAIAKNLFEMAKLKTQIIVVLIGEGCSGGAISIALGDTIGMLQHAYYSVISPEGCSSILWGDPDKKKMVAEKLKMHAEDLLHFGIIDEIIEEPLGGAHHDPDYVYKQSKQFILKELEALSQLSCEDLVERRFQKFRKIGSFGSHAEQQTNREEIDSIH